MITISQFARHRNFATVTDDPLDKKVEMTNWERVSSRLTLQRIYLCHHAEVNPDV